MPFANYSSFDDCVRKNSQKDDPSAYCAVIKRQTEGKLDYSEEELLALKQELDLNQTEFMKALTMLENKADASDLSVGDWVMINIGNESTLGQISGEAKESRTEEGNTIDGADGVRDVFRVDVWDSEAEELDESVIHPASRLDESDAPDGFSEKAEIDDKYLDERDRDFFVPNDTVAEEAQQALDWKEEHPDETEGGGSDGEGWRRAQQLVDYNSRNEALAIDFWEEIDAFHSRHHAQGNHELDAEFEGEPWKDAGYISHLTWGGDAGLEQAESVVEVVEEVDG